MLLLNLNFAFIAVPFLYLSNICDYNVFIIWIRYQCLLCFALFLHFIKQAKDYYMLLCRENLVKQPFQFKIGTCECGHLWDKVAANLKKIGEPRFSFDQRAVRDRFLKLERVSKKD